MTQALVAVLFVAWIASPFGVAWPLRRGLISERIGAIALLGIAPVCVLGYGIIHGMDPLTLLILILAGLLPVLLLYRPFLTIMGDFRRRD